MNSLKEPANSRAFRFMAGAALLILGVLLWPGNSAQSEFLPYVPSVLCIAVVGLLIIPCRGVALCGVVLVSTALYLNLRFVRLDNFVEAIVFEVSIALLVFGGAIFRIGCKRKTQPSNPADT